MKISNRLLTRLIPTLVLSCLFAVPAGVSSYAADSVHALESGYDTVDLYGTWQRDDKGWWFAQKYGEPYPVSRWGTQNGKWYYFDDQGYMATGWQYYYGSWYYLTKESGKEEGAMVIGWLYDPDYQGWFYMNQFGVSVTGWHNISGYWYYLNPHSDGTLGRMAVSQMVDGTYVDADGRMNVEP